MIQTFDLSAKLANIPIQDPRYGVVVRCLRNIEAVAAIHTDLREAKQALDLVCRTSPPAQKDAVDSDEPLICEALFVHALMLYCRALHSSTKNRHKIDVLGRYCADQREKHKSLTSLRDTVIAHYGTGRDTQPVSWIADHVVLRLDDETGGMGFSYPHMRAAFKADTLTALIELVEASLVCMDQSGTEHQSRLAAALQLLSKDQYLRELIRQHPFSEQAYFGRNMPPGSPDMRFIVPKGELPRD